MPLGFAGMLTFTLASLAPLAENLRPNYNLFRVKEAVKGQVGALLAAPLSAEASALF